MKPCSCGLLPVMVTRVQGVMRSVVVECACGKRTALMAFRRPDQTLTMKETAERAWNILVAEPVD